MLTKFFNPVFAPETLTGPKARGRSIVHGHGFGGAVYAQWGSFTVPANVEDGDIFEMCKVPPGFMCLGGWFSAGDLDTGTEALDMDLGWAANGAGSESWVAPWGTEYPNAAATADADGLSDMGVLTGDAVAGVVDKNWRAIALPAPLWFADTTIIQVEANVAANAFASQPMTVCLLGQIWAK